MGILNKLKNFLVDHEADLIKKGIDLAEENIGKGKNTDKKEFVIKFVLAMAHIPADIQIGLFKFDVAEQIVNVTDEAVQYVFDLNKNL